MEKKKTIIWTIVLIAPWLLICIVQLICTKNLKEPSGWYDFIFPALTALYTGFSVMVAYTNLVEEKNSLIRQTKISVFSEAMHLLANDIKYQEALEYILSGAYDKDIIVVKKTLNKKTDIGLDNYWQILYQDLRAEGVVITIEDLNALKKSQEKIKYFCQKMEYLGVISEDKVAATFIVELYGDTIIDTYKILRSLIHKTRENPKSKDLYRHYTFLYNFAEQEKTNHK